MELRIFTEPQQGATYDQLLASAQLAEQCGFGAWFRSDHYSRLGPGDPGAGPTDSWVTLGALARETDTIRLGTLVTSATFRLPGPLAIAVSQVDQMSGGRLDFGLGTGWNDDEHRHHGIPFPPLKERFARFEEQLQILHGIWNTPPGQTFTHTGSHYQLDECPALPKPAQPGGPPVIIGGLGLERTPALAARYAAEFNSSFAPLEYYRLQVDAARAACDDIGRDPDDLILSVAQVVCVAENDTDLAYRAGRIGKSVADLRDNALCGSPAEVLEKLADWAETGATRVYLQTIDIDDLDHVRLIDEQIRRLLP
jgi:F420-dependent oxidoreductase-like protein